MTTTLPQKESPRLQSSVEETHVEIFAEKPFSEAIELAFGVGHYAVAVLFTGMGKGQPVFYYGRDKEKLSEADEKHVLTFCENLLPHHGERVFSGIAPQEGKKHNTLTITDYVGISIKISHSASFNYLYFLNTPNKSLNQQQTAMMKILARDINSQFELSRKNRQLFEANEIYRLITEGNPDFIFAKDKDYKLVFANQAFMAIYPADKQDKIIGYTTLEEYDDAEAEAFLEQDKLALEVGFSETFEKIAFPDGNVRTLHTTKKRFFDYEKNMYLLGVSRDVTERETLIQQLEKSNKELNQFAYVASHDLKAPLSAISRLSSWIEADCGDILPEESKEHLDLIVGRCKRMQCLLEDLLDYSRANRHSYKPEILTLASLVDGLMELVDKPESFTIKTQDVQVYLPRVPLERILVNLISNAIKHHDKSAGIIQVACEKYKKHYVLSVTDDGPGIPDDLKEKAFNMFQTLKPRDEVEGSGMGLSMVKKLVEHNEGTIQITNNESRGCNFVITWPLATQ